MKPKLSALVFAIAAFIGFAIPAHAADLEVNLNSDTNMFSFLNFTLVEVGSEKTGTISVTNTSSEEIQLTPVLGGGTENVQPGEFKLLTPDDTTLSPNESLTLEVTLAPTSLGYKSAWVKLSEEAPYEKFLEFSGSSIEDTGEGYYLYKAEAGDTITSIAERFDMKKSDIMESNGIITQSELRVGDILKIYKSQIGDIPLGTPTGASSQPDVDSVQSPGEPKFTDITNHWASPYITKLFKLGIINGRTETIFAPNDTVNRAELTKMVVNAAGLEINESETSSSFSDVPEGHWAIPYIQAAQREGIIEGYNVNGQIQFKPGKEVNRAEAIKMILFAAGYTDVSNTTSENVFSDVAQDAWYAKYVYFAAQNDFAAGYVDGTFRPGASLTRGGAAKFVALTFGL